jgi:hypothetical protein
MRKNYLIAQYQKLGILNVLTIRLEGLVPLNSQQMAQ